MQLAHEGDQCHFRGIGCTGDHRFCEEGAAQCYAVEPAHLIGFGVLGQNFVERQISKRRAFRGVLARIIHDGPSRTRADAKRDGHLEP